MIAHDAVGDREPQAGAGCLATAQRALGGDEGLEDLVADLLGDAGAGIDDADLDRAVVLA